jgi:hypothetical protein
MEQPKIIESIGYIVKVEILTTVKFNILKNTLVLESLEPFPGYHGNHPPLSFKPRILYLVTQEEHTFEEIAIKSKDIFRFFKHRFDGTPAEINIFNQTYHAIRIRFLESFELIPELQMYYQDMGIRFLKTRQIESPATIKVHRYYLVEEIEEGIYRDLTEAEQYYVEVPKRLIWKAFEGITMTVKNNLDNNNFDAALGLMYRYNGPVDLVRIWDKNNSPERSRIIRNKYLSVLQSYQ